MENEKKYELVVGVDNRKEIYDSLWEAERWAEQEGYYLLDPDFSHDEAIKYFLYRSEEAAEEDKYATYPIGEIREVE